MKRCSWVGNQPNMIKYHDEEWGVLTKDDKILFEFIVLESAQAGLSWKTILDKRDNYKKAFYNFDFVKVSNMTDDDVEWLMNHDGIIKNRLKIKATINNAKRFIEVVHEFGSFYNYLKTFIQKPIVNKFKAVDEIPAKTDVSEKISKDLKRRGFQFVGPTIVYAFLQATGFINDHLVTCPRWREVQNLNNNN